jgi:hypothetical protein
VFLTDGAELLTLCARGGEPPLAIA